MCDSAVYYRTVQRWPLASKKLTSSTLSVQCCCAIKSMHMYTMYTLFWYAVLNSHTSPNITSQTVFFYISPKIYCGSLIHSRATVCSACRIFGCAKCSIFKIHPFSGFFRLCLNVRSHWFPFGYWLKNSVNIAVFALSMITNLYQSMFIQTMHMHDAW